ncbi:MAG: tRNA dihydrouridine synthase DusB [Candidatus Eisenbacteria sp.]|nr:tRNA dihydrouridine synthase DusB [Candidatus Eisenbacteria bacterium]
MQTKAVATSRCLDYSPAMGLEFLDRDYPVVLAPLAGYSVRPFRKICLEHGAAAVWSGMISADGLVRRDKESRRAAHFDEAERPIGLQLFGAKPDVMGEAAAILSEQKPDFIDLNAGCPVKKVCKRNGGSALLKEPELVGRIVETMVEASDVPVTVKIRIGWQKDHCNHLEVARIVEEAGAAAISVHGRTRSERFEGRAEWRFIGEVVDTVSIPVLGNGDVNTPLDAERMFKETGCSGVMIGRAAMGNPWIFGRVNAWLRSKEDIPEPTPAERAETCFRHAESLLADNDEEPAMREFRKFLVRYSKGLPYSSRLRRHLPELSSLDRLKAALDELLDSLDSS